MPCFCSFVTFVVFFLPFLRSDDGSVHGGSSYTTMEGDSDTTTPLIGGASLEEESTPFPRGASTPQLKPTNPLPTAQGMPPHGCGDPDLLPGAMNSSLPMEAERQLSGRQPAGPPVGTLPTLPPGTFQDADNETQPSPAGPTSGLRLAPSGRTPVLPIKVIRFSMWHDQMDLLP